jgi:RecA/RadA recombinase
MIDEDLELMIDDVVSVDEKVVKEGIDIALAEIAAIKITEEDKEKYKKSDLKKSVKKVSAKKDIPTPTELNNMTDSEVEASADNSMDEIKALYSEFNSFLEDKTKIKEDVGTKETIPTGIDVLDSVMGGGWALGTMGMIIGTPGCGKSMLSCQSAGSGQLKYKGKIIINFLDSEQATTTVRLANLGVRYPKIRPYSDMTIEKVFKFIEGHCLFKETKDILDIPSIIIWDSIANTLSQKEREAEDINSVLGYKARLLSVLVPKYVAKITSYNICLLTVNQLRDNIQIGPFQQPKDLNFMRQGKTIPGGNSLKFNAFHLLDAKVKATLKPETYGFDGVCCEIKCIKNKLFPPNIPVELIGNFVTGFSNFWTNYNFLTNNKRLVTGAWNYLSADPTKKFRTKDAKITYESDEGFRKLFDEVVKEAIQTEILDKNNPDLF